MPSRNLHRLKLQIFEYVLFALFLIGLAKLLYYEVWH
jgi:hypothetical protein